MKKIQNISSETTVIVRNPVLREGKPIESCRFDGDDLETTSHFGLFINEKLIGVVSVFKSRNLNFKAENQFQIRGMAVLKEHQKKGYGELLVKHCERYAIEEKSDLIWFNARETAVLFYEKLGYNKVGNPFSIADIGIHYVMKKEIG
ncbi:GNAT family N-acetyltransferase [Flavobacterium sp. SUN052]|uniref:GNAT family N-acetyltransferase n=1 Tax=Flavobacterium sp. SUN052 TaxID=3002441 RepID=UPI00237D7718|nr:GNAT family N-acetyltransferase [Flavobacterium sp. SUN052]MEC4003113.1 GNAT family N-acetyltransferase [Flavobacterium sp. SUN052]